MDCSGCDFKSLFSLLSISSCIYNFILLHASNYTYKILKPAKIIYKMK